MQESIRKFKIIKLTGMFMNPYSENFILKQNFFLKNIFFKYYEICYFNTIKT